MIIEYANLCYIWSLAKIMVEKLSLVPGFFKGQLEHQKVNQTPFQLVLRLILSFRPIQAKQPPFPHRISPPE